MLASLILILIVSCEVAFWLVLIAGLSARYIFKRQKLSKALLCLVPWIDVILLIAVVLDLRSGAVATFAHGLAAAYIGFTVAFGKSTLAWVDRVFAHRFSDGPKPATPPTHGRELFLYELKWFGRCLLAVSVTIALSFAAIIAVNDPAKTAALNLWTKAPLITAALWFVFGPLWSVLFHWPAPRPQAGRTQQNSCSRLS